jgi:ParB family chromosome partitioning protein
MKITKSRLGRGLSSLISVSELPVETEVSARSVANVKAPMGGDIREGRSNEVESPLGAVPAALVPVRAVEASPNQPRRSFDDATLQQLAASLKSAGLIQPIIVRRLPAAPGPVDGPGVALGSPRYQLIAGERRWRAAKLAGIEAIPAIIRDVDNPTQSQLALIENIHRQDLNPIDRAMGYRSLIDQLGLTQAELAGRLGEERSGIANYLRLLELAEPVKAMIADGRLTLGHGKLLAGVPDVLEQHKLAQSVIAQEMSVRALERTIQSRAGNTPPPPPPAMAGSNAHLQDLERSLGRQLGMKVQLRSTAKKGKGRLIIHYATLDQFDDLMSRLGVRAE